MDSVQINSDQPNTTIKLQRVDKVLSDKEYKKNLTSKRGDNSLIAMAPVSFRLSRKGNYSVVATKPGYKTTTSSIGHKVSGAGAMGLAGNALIGGVIGIGVDALSGASLDLTPNPLNLKMERR